MAVFKGSSVVDIGVALTLQDRFSGPAGKALNGWRKALADMNTYASGVRGAFSNYIRHQGGYIRDMARAFEYSAKVQDNTFLASKILRGDIKLQKDLLDRAKEINVRNPLTLMDITSGMKFMAMAGMTAEQIKAAAEPAAQMAGIFGMEMGGKGGTADLLTNIMATYQIQAKEAVNVADALSVGSTSANMSLQDLAQSVKYAGAKAKLSGISLHELIAAIGVLGNYGIQGSMAGTNYAQALNAMNKAIAGTSKAGAEAIKALGLGTADFETAEGNLKPIHEILTKIAQATKGMGNVKMQAMLSRIFGNSRGLRAVMPIIEDILTGAGQYEKIMANIESAAGWNESTTKERLETPKGMIEQTTSAFENLIVTINEGLTITVGPILKGAQFLAGILSDIAGTIGGKWLVGVVAIRTGIKFIAHSAKLINTSVRLLNGDLFSSSNNSRKLATGLGTATMNAARLETHMRNITILTAQASLRAGQSATLWGGRAYKDKNGKLYFRRLKRKGLGESFFGGDVSMGAPLHLGMAGMYSSRRGPGLGLGKGLSSSYYGKGLSKMMAAVGFNSRTSVIAGRGLMKGIGTMSGLLGGIASFLTGPLGLLATTVITGIPLLISLLSGKDKEADLKAKREAEILRLREAINKGDTTVTVNINGKPAARLTGQDEVNIDWDDDYDQTGIDLEY